MKVVTPIEHRGDLVVLGKLPYLGQAVPNLLSVVRLPGYRAIVREVRIRSEQEG